MTEHQGYTPGPWIAGRPDMGTIVDGYESKWIYDDRDQYVAVASGRIDGEWDEVMANARLIADAPNLYKENVALRDQVVRMREALEMIEEHLNADNEESYRADDPEGAMDTCFAMARAALEPKPSNTPV